MTRPALIIGAGGTGQWVLSFLKKDLLEIGGGELPKNIALLCFDTTEYQEAGIGYDGGKEKTEAVRAGAVSLDKGTEYVPITGSVYDLAKEIGEGKYSHLQWFPAKRFIEKLPPSAFDLNRGAGGLRAFGRMAIFRDVTSISGNRVIPKIDQALKKLQGSVTKDEMLEIIIVGSIAGGTGSGMLADLAQLVRNRTDATPIKGNYIIRAFIFGPRTFVTTPDMNRQMYAASFAAWREIDRSLVMHKDYGGYPVKYHDTNQALQFTITDRLFDESIMIDPMRSKNSLLGVKPKDGVFPTVAQAISSIIDGKSGQLYTDRVTTNKSVKLAALQTQPYHSAMGTYTIKLPVYYAHEKYSHKLAIEVMNLLLSPNENKTDVSEIDNKEDAQGIDPFQVAYKFMSSDGITVDDGENHITYPNTDFLPMVAEARLQKYNEDAENKHRWARQMVNPNNLPINKFMRLSRNQQKIVGEIDWEKLHFPIWAFVKPFSETRISPADAFNDVQNKVKEVTNEWFGLEDSEDHIKYRGKYGEMLAKAKQAHLESSKTMLAKWTERTLNGKSQDIRISRSGKIGYIRGFYRNFSETLEYFIEFLDSVKDHRNEDLKIKQERTTAVTSRLANYKNNMDKKCPLCFWDDYIHPDAIQAQRDYLEAVNLDIQRRKEDIFLEVMRETAVELNEYAKNTLFEINDWIYHLMNGIHGVDERGIERNVEGLYRRLLNSAENVEVNYKTDANLSQVIRVLENTLAEEKEVYLEQALGRLHWEVDGSKGKKLTINFFADFPTDGDGNSEVKKFACGEYEAWRHNLSLLLGVSAGFYRDIVDDLQQNSFINELKKVFPQAKDLANETLRMAEPLFFQSTQPSMQAQDPVCYVRVAHNADPAYFDAYEREYKEVEARLDFEVVESDDPFKLTIFRADNLMPSQNFDQWEKCRDAYISVLNDPTIDITPESIHILPAVQNAAKMELHMKEVLMSNYRILTPKIVALLENSDNFFLFFLAVALGYIKRQADSDGDFYWSLINAGPKEIYLTTPREGLNKEGIADNDDDFFRLIYKFALVGKDARQKFGINVNYSQLTKVIKEYRNKNEEEYVNALIEQVESNDGLVAAILNEGKVFDVELSQPTADQQAYLDLADIAKVIYFDEIHRINKDYELPEK
jgi:hypothetical protein